MKNSILVKNEKMKLRELYNLPDKFLLCVTRFVEKKNLFFLINAFCEFLRNTDTDFNLIIVGDGPLKEKVCNAIPDRFSSRIFIRPFLQSKDLSVYYSLSSCVVLASSHNEQWGLVVNEAMASSTPVMVSNICGCSFDLVRNGVNGYTFDPFSIEDFVNKFSDIIKTEDRIKEMGHESFQIIQKFSCEWAAENLKNLINQIMAK